MIAWYDATNCTSITLTTCGDDYHAVKNYTPVIDHKELDAAALAKIERAIESARIAAELEPPALVPRSYVPRIMRPVRQPPGRFAYYQGDGF